MFFCFCFSFLKVWQLKTIKIQAILVFCLGEHLQSAHTDIKLHLAKEIFKRN